MAVDAAVGGGLGAAVLGTLGSLGQLAFGTRPVQEWLRGCQARLLAGRLLPGNHDLVKGIRTAHLCALDHVARRHRELLGSIAAGEIDADERPFAALIEPFIGGRLKVLHDRGIDHDTLTEDDIRYVLDHLVHPGTSEGYGEVAAHARQAAEATALTELEADAGYAAPPLFRQIFTASGGWHDAFALFVTEQLKTDERFRSIFLAAELIDIKQAIAALGGQQAVTIAAHPDLAGFLTSIDLRLGRIELGVAKVQSTADRIESGLGDLLRTVLGGARTTVIVRGATVAAVVGASVFVGSIAYHQLLAFRHQHDLATLDATRKQDLATAVAAAKEEARKEVEAAKYESGLKDQIIAAKDQAIDALAKSASGPGGEASRRAIDSLTTGDAAPAQALTENRAEAKAARALQATADAEKLRREAASDFRQLGALAWSRDREKSLAAYRRAIELDAEDAESWIWLGRLEEASGRNARALEAYGRAQTVAENTGKPNLVARAEYRKVDVLVKQGDRRAALEAAREALSAFDRLLLERGDDLDLLRDRSVSLNKIGDVLLLEGDRAGALQAFRDGLAIMDDLAGRDPGNTQWQRDRSVSLTKIGDVLRLEGDRAGALQAFREGLAIMEDLAGRDPGNTQWQHDRSVSLERIGDVLLLEGDRAGALQAFRDVLAIADDLARRDPGNTEWQHDRSLSLGRIGDVLRLEGDRAGALQAFRDSLAIMDNLVRLDPGNTEWQRDRSVSLSTLGDVLRLEGDRAGALQAFREGLAIRDDLAGRDPGNTQWQHDLIVSHWKLADLLEKAPEEREAAKEHWRQALRLAKSMAAAGKELPADAYFVPTILNRLRAFGD